MSRLADYFVIVGYDHEKESKCIRLSEVLIHDITFFMDFFNYLLFV